MASGVHYAEFLWEGGPAFGERLVDDRYDWAQSDSDWAPAFGVVGPDFDAARPAFVSPGCWMLCASDGTLRCDDGQTCEWRGQEPAAPGDVIGLLVDLDAGRLSAYKNGRRLGSMLRPGFSSKARPGVDLPPLVGPLRWAVDLHPGGHVRIERKPPPPMTADEVAEDEEYEMHQASAA